MKAIILSLPLLIFLCQCSSNGNGTADTDEDTDQDPSEEATDSPDLGPCETNADCSNGLVCDGEEQCVDGECLPGEALECDDEDSCTMDDCDEDEGGCIYKPLDEDNDGYVAASCGGVDCSDEDASVYPGAPADCTGGNDMDCDTLPDMDEDGDGFAPAECGGEDCDDADAASFPGSTAVDCSSDDHDCNGEEDNDNDGDGEIRDACGGSDCDDADAGVGSDMTENVCDGKDTNCDGLMDEYEDEDYDGYANEACAAEGAQVDCVDDDPDVNPGMEEICDTIDQNCDGSVLDAPGADDDGDTVLDESCGGDDCDDLDPMRYGGAAVDCSTVDHDCNGHPDNDQDGDGSIRGPDSSGWPDCGGDDCDDAFPLGCWVSVPAGSFDMGCSPGDEECESSEMPRHTVDVDAFRMTETEITQAQYEAVTGETPSSFSGCPDCPVERVDWYDAKAFCEAIGARLPSEAEWEYAARAGTSTRYYCGHDEACLDDIAWYNANAEGATHPVAEKTPNAFGLHDMLGNVFEWVEDCWHENYDGAPSTGGVWEGGLCDYRLMRGGSWDADTMYLGVSPRYWISSDSWFDDFGLRCAQ